MAAAIIRDFWVAEDFFTKHTKREIKYQNNNNRKKPKRIISRNVIYLPRKRIFFTHKESPSLEKINIVRIQIAPHSVIGHLRKLQEGHQASEYAIENASEYGLKLIGGYTFVKPYNVDKSEYTKTFRSKSALQLLYGKK